jgi:hypothetical protein
MIYTQRRNQAIRGLWEGAPGASRTRDLLLRRQLLYPLSYRG